MKTKKIMCINLMLVVMIGCCVKISTAISDSCPVSPLTVQAVDDCPDTEEEWMKAAVRKNCTAYASQCDKPDRLVYHCVINAYVNQTLEVCAYSRIIVLGYCTEYSLGGNIIQPSFVANCTQFKKNPCPVGYQSTDAFKYPGCYGLTKKTTSATDVNNDEGSSKDVWLPILIVLVCLVLIAVIGITFRHGKAICSLIRKKDINQRNKEYPLNYTADRETDINQINEEDPLHYTADRETEHSLTEPSRQIIGNGHIAFPSRS